VVEGGTLEIGAFNVHISVMFKAASAPKKFVRLDNGEMVELRGFGALKGQLTLMPGIDLTKPIYEQVIRKTTPKAASQKR